MKSAVRSAIAVLMLLGLSAAVMPKNTKNTPVVSVNNGPMPVCDPGGPSCPPVLPPPPQ